MTMKFKIATWNINSIRVRMPHLLNWVAAAQPQVIALQETKVEDHNFPLAELQTAGYHIVSSGQKSYNGVALLSKMPLEAVVTDIPLLTDPQRRILAATVNDVRIINLYVPNGESVGSEKYFYKLDWLKKITAYLEDQLNTYKKLIVLGDFNIAPEDRDVHDPQLWSGHVLVSEQERSAFRDLLDIGLLDTFRLFEQQPASFSWWDYRAVAFRRNHGLRIDHILASETLASLCRHCTIDKEPRGWERPSDHTPVIATFAST